MIAEACAAAVLQAEVLVLDEGDDAIAQVGVREDVDERVGRKTLQRVKKSFPMSLTARLRAGFAQGMCSLSAWNCAGLRIRLCRGSVELPLIVLGGMIYGSIRYKSSTQ